MSWSVSAECHRPGAGHVRLGCRWREQRCAAARAGRHVADHGCAYSCRCDRGATRHSETRTHGRSASRSRRQRVLLLRHWRANALARTTACQRDGCGPGDARSWLVVSDGNISSCIDEELVEMIRSGGATREAAWSDMLRSHTPKMYARCTLVRHRPSDSGGLGADGVAAISRTTRPATRRRLGRPVAVHDRAQRGTPLGDSTTNDAGREDGRLVRPTRRRQLQD